MRFKLIFAAALAALAVSSFAASTLPKVRLAIPTRPKTEIVPGQLLVRLRLGPGRTAPAHLSGLPFGSKLINALGFKGWTLYAIPPSVNPRQAALFAMQNRSVSWAEPVNRTYILSGPPNDLDWGVQETDPEVVLDLGDVNPSFTRLWHLDDDFALDAWNMYPNTYYTSVTKPSNVPMIAIIDSGCDKFHPDFINAGGMSTDTALGGQLNWSLSRHFSNGAPDNGSWDDQNGHGTHVTGLALAAANNTGFDGHGVPSVGYAAQGMILRVIDQNGSGTDTDAAAAIVYAADNGADVINLSLGTENYSQVFQDAVTYAFQKGSLVVCAGNENGNGGGDLGPIYPAACSGALAVEANGPDSVPATATYAGFGNYVDIAAPGGDLVQTPDYILIQFVWSTAMETPGGPGSLYDLSDQGVLYPPYHLNYAYLAGTSMASPQVAGSAALYYAAYGLRQGQGHANLRAYRALERTAQGVMGAPLGAWEPYQGYGSLDEASLLTDGNARGASVGSIEGIVYEGGTPVPNVQVRAQSIGGGTNYSTTTHGDGEYRFDSMPPGTYNVTAAPFGHAKTKKCLVMVGSDATNIDFWCAASGSSTDPWDSTPPVVSFFTIDSFNSSSVSLSQWGYDPESSIDSLKIRIGTSQGAQDVYPETELVTEQSSATLTGLTLQNNVQYWLRATYTDGAGFTTVVDRTIGNAPAQITGTLTLQDYPSATPVPITVEVRNPGSTTALQTYNLNQATGSFTFNAPSPGTYDIAFKGSHWLRVVVHNVVVTGAGASGLTPSLVNGDVNGDNAVTVGDFIQLRAAFGSAPGDGNWNVNADLNGSAAVTVGDFTILRSRFGLSGDP